MCVGRCWLLLLPLLWCCGTHALLPDCFFAQKRTADAELGGAEEGHAKGAPAAANGNTAAASPKGGEGEVAAPTPPGGAELDAEFLEQLE